MFSFAILIYRCSLLIKYLKSDFVFDVYSAQPVLSGHLAIENVSWMTRLIRYINANISRFFPESLIKVPLRRKFCIPFSLQLLKVEVINTYHAKFYIEIPTGRPVILIVKFSFVLPPLLDSKNGREPHRELDLVAPRGI